MADVFLSHADEDEECVRAIARALDVRGCSAFVDKDANIPRVTFIQPGEHWKGVLDSHLDRAAVIAVLWTKHSVDKRWVRYEADRGKERRTLFSVTKGQGVPKPYRAVQAVDLSEWVPGSPSRQLDDLVRALAVRIQPMNEVRDQVVHAFAARFRGDHEGAADSLARAADDFRLRVLDDHQRRKYAQSQTYQGVVLDLLRRIGRDIVHPHCPPVVRQTLSGASFLPVVDAVLELPVDKVRSTLNCCPLRPDVDDLPTIRVGVVIRSGDDLHVENLALKLSSDWEQGALALHCYLLVVNSKRTRLCQEFEQAAARVDLRAKGIALPLKTMNRDQLESRLRTAMHDLCLQPAAHH